MWDAIVLISDHRLSIYLDSLDALGPGGRI